MSTIPKWMHTVYVYLLSGNPDLKADNLEVYTDIDGGHWVQSKGVHYACVDEYPSLQEFLDGLQDTDMDE